MSTYVLDIDGTRSLSEINGAIVREEATGAEFMQCSLGFHNNRITNLATMKDLPPGTRPSKDIELCLHSEPVPQGKSSIWAGVMLVSGSNAAVVAYR